jgi:hypothetical protein
MPKPANRLDARLFRLTHEIKMEGQPAVLHKFEMQVGLDPCSGQVVEIAFASRGRVGQGFDLLLMDVGLWISRVLQNRDPETGAELPKEEE